MARERKGSVESLKDKLYSRESGVHIDPEERTPLSPHEAHVSKTWENDVIVEPTPAEPMNLSPKKRKGKLSVALKFFIGSMVFFCIAAAAAAFMFFFGGNSISPQHIDLSVVMPSVIDGGKPANMQILINNRNPADLKLVDLIITYPAGTRDPKNPTASLTHDRQSLGVIAAGEQVKRTAQAIFYGQEGQSQHVSVQLQYSIEGSNAVFEKDAVANFTVGSSPVSISVSAPSEAIANQQFGMDITVQSNALDPVNDIVIKGQYPFGFTVENSTPSATAGGTLWRLGTMKPGETKVIHLTGTLDGQDGDTRVFYFIAGTTADQTDTQIKVPLLSVPQTLVVRRAFITAQISVNNQSGKNISASSGTPLQGTVTWTNNLPDTVSDVIVKLSLKGPTLDPSSISSQSGFYQSSDNTILWSKDQNSALGSVAPGASGTLPFTFSTLPVGSGGTLYSNPVIDLNVTVQAARQGQGDVPETVSSAAASRVLLSSAAHLQAQAFHFTGPFANTGPMPPQAEQNTTYSIVWTVTNSSNTIANAAVSATLPQYVTFVSAQSGSGITYDAKSRTVTWTLGDVKAGTGYTLSARTGAFQVSLFPSASQVGQAPTLTNQATLVAQDRFAQVGVSATVDAPTTQLQSDAGFGANMGTVAPK
jgi:hypothetical protein